MTDADNIEALRELYATRNPVGRFAIAIKAAIAALEAGGVGALERAAEEIEHGHPWITSAAASVIIRKHAAAPKASEPSVDRILSERFADYLDTPQADLAPPVATLTQTQVAQLAALAKRAEAMAGQIAETLAFVAKLRNLRTRTVEGDYVADRIDALLRDGLAAQERVG